MSEQSQPRTRRRVLRWVLVAVPLVLVLAAGFAWWRLSQPKTYDVHGWVIVNGRENMTTFDGPPTPGPFGDSILNCTGGGSFADVGTGTPVAVAGTDGTALVSTAVGGMGVQIGAQCWLPFAARIPVGSDPYRVTVGGHDPVSVDKVWMSGGAPHVCIGDVASFNC